MNAYATHGGVEKKKFEAYALAASIVGKCHFCVQSHYELLKKEGLTTQQLRDIGRIAAVVNAAAQVLRRLARRDRRRRRAARCQGWRAQRCGTSSATSAPATAPRRRADAPAVGGVERERGPDQGEADQPVRRRTARGTARRRAGTGSSGSRYCIRPSVVSEIRRAAKANSSSGTVVAGPRPSSQRLVAERRARESWSGCCPTTRPCAATAAGARIMVSKRQAFERAEHRDLAQQAVGAEASGRAPGRSTAAVPALDRQPDARRRRRSPARATAPAAAARRAGRSRGRR